MNTAVIEFDPLADAVGAAAQDHDLGTVCVDLVVVRRVVSGVVVSAVLCAAHVHGIPGFGHAQGCSFRPDLVLRHIQDLAEIFVGETVLLGVDQHFVCDRTSDEGFLLLDKLLHLLYKIVLDSSESKDLICRSALSERLIHDKIPLTARGHQKL